VEQLTRQAAKGGSISFAGQVVGKILNLALQVLLTRTLGASGYGLYALGYSVLGIGQTAGKLGFQSGVIRFGSMYYGAGDTARLKGTLIFALGVSFGVSVLIGIGMFLFAEPIAESVFGEPLLTNPLRVFAAVLPFHVLVAIASVSARALRRIDIDVTVSHVFLPLLTLIGVGASFLLGYRLMGAVSSLLVSSIVAAGLGVALLRHLFPDLISDLAPRWETKRLLSYSVTVLLVGLSHLLLTRIDRIMLGILRDAKDVGTYNAAATLAFQATLFLSSFNMVFSPMIADLFHKGRKAELGQLFKTVTKWIFTLTLPVSLALAIFSRPLMQIFGPGFSLGTSVLISLSFAQLVNAGVGSVGFMLTMTGRHRLELLNSILLGLSNVLLNLLLIPKYGVLGAGIATGVSIAAMNVLRLVQIYVLYGIHPYKTAYWKPLTAGIIASIAWFAVRIFWSPEGWQWAAAIAFFGAMYCALVVILGLDPEDRKILRVVVNRIRPK